MTSRSEQGTFDLIFERVLNELPDEVRDMLEEVPVIVDDEPSDDILKSMNITARPGESDLCGLHSGIPLGQGSTLDASMPQAPAQIYLFRGPLLRTSNYDLLELEEQIRITLLHEIGHHFGLSEEDLDELGYA